MIEQLDAGWSVREFHGVELGDARLDRRLLALAEAFGAQPTAPINQASDDWYATKAADRRLGAYRAGAWHASPN